MNLDDDKYYLSLKELEILQSILRYVSKLLTNPDKKTISLLINTAEKSIHIYSISTQNSSISFQRILRINMLDNQKWDLIYLSKNECIINISTLLVFTYFIVDRTGYIIFERVFDKLRENDRNYILISTARQLGTEISKDIISRISDDMLLICTITDNKTSCRLLADGFNKFSMFLFIDQINEKVAKVYKYLKSALYDIIYKI